MRRREYGIKITVNGQKVTQVVIDPHYELKHLKVINDELIVELVRQLNGLRFEPVDTDPPFQYFVTDGLWLKGKTYKLVWLLEQHKVYIGVVNAHRRK